MADHLDRGDGEGIDMREMAKEVEEIKLQSKYPLARSRSGGHLAFLQKQMAKEHKYFDSGEYQVAKQTGQSLDGTPSEIATVEAIQRCKAAGFHGKSKLAEEGHSLQTGKKVDTTQSEISVTERCDAAEGPGPSKLVAQSASDSTDD